MVKTSAPPTALRESQADLYESACRKMEAGSMMIKHAFKADNYLNAAQLFAQAGDYLDSARKADACREMAQRTREEGIRYSYQQAVEKMDSDADTEKDWEKLSDNFRELGDFEDSPRRYAACRQKALERERKRKRKTGGTLACILAVALLAASVFLSGIYHYVIGLVYMKAGMFTYAEASFAKGPAVFGRDEKITRSRNLQLSHATVGDTVSFGDLKWKVLTKNSRKEQITLIVSSIDKEGDLYAVAFDEEGKADGWADSSLCAWLNADFLDIHFSDAERDMLCEVTAGETKNTQYQTTFEGAGPQKLMILSGAEARRYATVTDSLGNDWWLRTPGHARQTAAYMSAQHILRAYGVPMDTKLTVRPVAVVDISGIE